MDQKPTSKIKTFEDLIVWQKAHQMVLEVYRIARIFPPDELYGLTSQVKRSASSVPTNIVEGFKRRGKADKIKFYNTAQSSLDETRYHLILARDLEFCKPQNILLKIEEVSKLLEKFIQATEKSIDFNKARKDLQTK